MKFAIFTHVNHISKDGSFYAYGPYVKEMNIWFKYVDEVIIVAPKSKADISKIDLPYSHDRINFEATPSFSLTSLKSIFRALIVLPQVFWTTYRIMQKADHFHLRCPGNAGLVACVVQIFFPGKPKTAKYAGNWDPNSKQPWSYRLQKWILSNTFLTRNMKVLVYGEWENSTKNIVPFFTATYKDSDKKESIIRKISEPLRFLFVGTLSKGKRPLYTVELIAKLKSKGLQVCLDVFGEGAERSELNDFIIKNNLKDCIFLHGNQPAAQIEKEYKHSHFLILPSQSEGWPKVVAEAMFWGCVPLSTKVSCVPYMIGEGSRGLLLSQELNNDVNQIVNLIEQPSLYEKMAEEGMLWSREFTLDKFEQEIADFLENRS